MYPITAAYTKNNSDDYTIFIKDNGIIGESEQAWEPKENHFFA